MISLDAFADQLFDGRVRRIAPYVLEEEKQARTVDVEVDFLCQEDCTAMLPGYSADVEIILDQRKDVLRIPTEAILEGNKVLLVDPDRILQSRAIETGISNWEWTEITQGLSAGDEIVISVEREGVEVGVEVTPDSKSNQQG
jgi:HlyD family secretion protein